ncbi:MAG TPA: hypothetical protein VH561_10220 [Micromonosporaceae bacterium]|jgi:hypothetical protein
MAIRATRVIVPALVLLLALLAFSMPANGAQPAGRQTGVTGMGVRPNDIYQCYVFPDGDGASEAYCSGTAPSQFRVWIICTGGGLYYGPWRTAGGGSTSYAQCTVNHFRVDDGVVTRSQPPS